MKPRIKAREDRLFEVAVELEERADAEKPVRIVGHPIVYGRWSEDLGGFREQVMPGAAARTLAEHDIRALFNHDPNIVLGRNGPGTLVLADGPAKLRMELFPPDTNLVRDMVLAPMRRKDVNQMSFAFRTVKDEWREPAKPGALWERDLHELRLYDVSVVTFPAYTQTDAAIRSVLLGSGIDFDSLSAALVRSERGVALTQSDHDLIRGSIAVLRSYLPDDPESDSTHQPASADPESDSTHQPSVRSVADLLREISLRERELRVI